MRCFPNLSLAATWMADDNPRQAKDLVAGILCPGRSSEEWKGVYSSLLFIEVEGNLFEDYQMGKSLPDFIPYFPSTSPQVEENKAN